MEVDFPRQNGLSLGQSYRVGRNFVRAVRRIPMREVGMRPSWERKFGMGFRPVRGVKKQRMRRRRVRKSVYQDRASYKQYSSTKRRYGRKLRALTRSMRLLKTVTEPIRYRFGSAKDQNAVTGSYWLTNQPITGGRVYPLYLTSLFNLRQGTALDNTTDAARHMYELGSTTGGLFFRAVNAIDPLNTAVTTNSVKQVAPTNSSLDQVGRKGLCDWTRIRLCFWAKTKNPSSIRVSLVRFYDEEFCPEFYDTKDVSVIGGFLTPKASEWYTQKLKYLLNGHMGVHPRFDRKKYAKVIKQWRLEMNPIDAGAETADSDPRGHMKHIDIFNRWNRVCDYTDRELRTVGYGNISDINRGEDPNSAFTGYLKNPEKGVYLMIESVQPLSETDVVDSNPRPAPVTANLPFAVSFDYIFESNFTVVKE